ncbi:hypothetical protein SB758_14880 [Burkholderia sp. SIMBA_013]
MSGIFIMSLIMGDNRLTTRGEPSRYADLRIAPPALVRRAGFRQRSLSVDDKETAAAQSLAN